MGIGAPFRGRTTSGDLAPDAVSHDAQPRDHHPQEAEQMGQLLLAIEAGVAVVVDRRQVDHEVQPQADGHHGHADQDETGQI